MGTSRDPEGKELASCGECGAVAATVGSSIVHVPGCVNDPNK